MALGGFSAFMNAYPAIRQAQEQEQMRRMQMAQQQRELAQQQATRQAYAQAIQGLSGMQGQGPGGAPTVQQLAGLAGGNPDVMTGLSSFARPAVTGGYGLQRAETTGNYGLERAQLGADAAQKRAETAGEYGLKRTEMATDAAQKRTETAGEYGLKREKMIQERTQQRQQQLKSGGKNLTYDAATKIYHETEVDMRELKSAYLRAAQFDPNVTPMDYVKDPQWAELAKQRKDAYDAMQGAAKNQPVESAKPSAATLAQPPIPGARQAPDGHWYVETTPGQFSRVDMGQ